MSLATLRERVHAESTAPVRTTLFRVVLGDRYGQLLFLSTLCLFGLVWRTEIFITDTYAIANGLYALTSGDVFLSEAVYGPTLDTPGAYQVNGGRIARNYGAIVPSLLFWVLLEGVAAVLSLRIALVGLWCLALLGVIVTLADIHDNDTFALAGGVVVLLVFVGNVVLAGPLRTNATHLYALQLFHMTVAAFGPVLLYRLLSRLESRRLGMLGATLFVLATPLALWAPVPKRHALTSTAVLGVVYALYRSRTAADGALFTSPVPFRALAYALVGLYAWVHAPEALLLLVVLFAVDVPTARDNSPRTLALVGGAFLLSLLPFALTNVALSGSPVEPPRLLATSAGSGGVESAGGSAGGGSTSPFEPLVSPLLSATAPLRILGQQLVGGLTVLFSTPEAVYHTLVRSGDAASALDIGGEESVNLTVLESAPILGALVGGLPAIWHRRDTLTLSRTLPARTTVDAFAVLTIVTMALLYASRLPIHAQVTVRYLFPVYPLGVYLVARVPVVRRTLDTRWRVFLWSTAIAVFIGGQLLVVFIFWTVVGVGEAFQFHALLALISGTALAVWASLGRSDGAFGRVGAVLLALPAALATLFVLVVAIEYYPVGDSHLLPMVRAVAELLDLL